jgi:hypothetical protein
MEELLVLLMGVLVIYLFARGIICLFQRYHPLLVIAYFIFIAPVALIHSFFLGIFGLSEEERLRKEAEREAKRQVMMEEEREKLGR